MMVGDSAHDMLTGRGGGVGCRVAILGGAGSEDRLQQEADELIWKIDDIVVVD